MWCVVWNEAEGQSELHHAPSAEVGNGDAEEEVEKEAEKEEVGEGGTTPAAMQEERRDEEQGV